MFLLVDPDDNQCPSSALSVLARADNQSTPHARLMRHNLIGIHQHPWNSVVENHLTLLPPPITPHATGQVIQDSVFPQQPIPAMFEELQATFYHSNKRQREKGNCGIQLPTLRHIPPFDIAINHASLKQLWPGAERLLTRRLIRQQVLITKTYTACLLSLVPKKKVRN